MELKKAVLTAVVIAAVACGQANAGHDKHHSHEDYPEETGTEKPEKPIFSGNIIHIEVNGLVCDFCARSIRKVFLKTGSVEEATVNLKHKFVTVYLKEEKTLSDKRVRKLLEDSGYATVSISRFKKEEKQ